MSKVIRDRLTDYVQTALDGALDNFAVSLRITHLRHLPIYSLCLDTLRETREVVRREKPYRGGALPPLQFTEQNIDVWDWEIPVEPRFDHRSSAHPVDGSQQLCACEACHREGKVVCP